MAGFASRPEGHRPGARRLEPHGWRETFRSEIGFARPTYQILDVGSAPDAVRARWTARRVQMRAGVPGRKYPASMLGRNVIASGVWASGFAIASVLADAGTALVMVPSAVFGLVPEMAAGTTVGGVAVVGGAVTATAGWRYLRDPKRLRRRERAAARKAMWITPGTLGYRRVKGIGRTTDEERLFHLAVHIGEGIIATNAWKSPLLDGHRVRLDLDESLGQMGRRLAQIRTLRDEMEAADDVSTRGTIAGYSRSLDLAFDSIAARVMTMHGYLEQLRSLDGKLWQLAQVERVDSMSDRVLDVLAATATDDVAAEQISALGSEAVDNAEAVTSVLDDLADTLSTFTLDTQSPLDGKGPA